MNSKSVVRYFNIFVFDLLVLFLVACASSSPPEEKDEKKLLKTFGNSENVYVFENKVMALHDIIVTQVSDGIEVGGHIHVRQHTYYTPGHIDLAVVDNTSKEVVAVVSTDFNPRIAEYEHRNLVHQNNFSVKVPNVESDKVTVYVAYHPSNVDRASRFDCGENEALAEYR
ncbi:MAG: hypothetical protein R3240_12455, partial [Gammaproteobacteria bacterium]|nr:hypothetical protein [Gammaproteobacteria bacterium]